MILDGRSGVNDKTARMGGLTSAAQTGIMPVTEEQLLTCDYQVD